MTLLPGEVYLPNGRMTWRVPAGEHRLAYAPGAFEAKRHVITARPMTAEEINGRRDIACNPADLRGETDFFPHITANVETRNEACFCARNAINGLHCNNYHGEWPFGSWGIGAREDAWCCIDFGREVTVDAMALILARIFRMTRIGSADTLCCPTARKSRSTCKDRREANHPAGKTHGALDAAGADAEERRPVGIPRTDRMGSLRMRQGRRIRWKQERIGCKQC